MRKINVIGTSGSGKSTFARALAQALDYPYIEMDALFWKPNWQESGDAEFFAKIRHATDADAWVLDGNYTRSQPIKWRDIDTIIWIDFGLLRTFYQALKRALSRIWTGQELWPNTGNRESLRLLFSRHSILLWTLRMYPINKKRYATLMNDPTLAQINFVRLTSTKQCQLFLTQLATRAKQSNWDT
ncbi:shikimate kinase [Gilvimarinus sp. SDUM040013]|uniref:Shikimate kinase n=1 Tax=Gilvimarinus gilvus TaxID=3058038 RepID=A0ABU4S1E9_9GAMM|nr:shikimate kinase [Gilvimarinus sp. SDUM040013]MDO3384400.1 shikimate kinase [Gilvimarinus sp. SDUM040013]MDX6851005.1 shikimate kinase [Gilvimarinus sp. SDUM040013]